MPKYEGDTAPASVTYKFVGHNVDVPLHFSPDRPLSENEARFANRQLASVTGNILASAVKRLVEAEQAKQDALADDDANVLRDADGKRRAVTATDLDGDTVRARFAEIFEGYEIGVNNNRGDGTANVHDPVESMARNMAWEIGVKPLLKAKGHKLNDIKADVKNRLIDQYLEAGDAGTNGAINLRAVAKAQFDAGVAANAQVAESLSLDNLTSAPAEGEAGGTGGTDGETQPTEPEVTDGNTGTEAEAQEGRGRRSRGEAPAE
jgi:hypothetical protein